MSMSNPRTHYVYRVFDDQGALLYVGCTKTPQTRYAAHMSGKTDARGWFDTWAHRWIFTGPFEKREALNLERSAIYTESPIWNANSPGRNNWGGKREAINAYVRARRIEVAA